MSSKRPAGELQGQFLEAILGPGSILYVRLIETQIIILKLLLKRRALRGGDILEIAGYLDSDRFVFLNSICLTNYNVLSKFYLFEPKLPHTVGIIYLN